MIRMEELRLSANAVLPVFLMMAAGYLARCLGVLERGDVGKMNRVAFRVFLPCLLFYNVYRSDLSSAVNGTLIAYAVLGVLTVFAAAYIVVLRLEPLNERRGVVMQGIFRSNYVILGLPIAQALLGETELGPVSVLIAIVVPMFNVLAVFVLERFRGGNVKPGEIAVQVLKNPLVVSSALGIAVLLLGIRLPPILEKTVSGLGTIATPLQLFLLGAFFRFEGLGRYARALTAVTTVKLVVTPAIFLSLAAVLGFRGVEFVALLGIFASPTAVNSFTMAQQMGGDAELAGDIVVSTSVFSALTMFGWIFLFKTLGIF